MGKETPASLELMNLIVTRTREGIDALGDCLRIALKEPERFSYVATGELAAWARIFGWEKLHRALAPTLHPQLAGAILRTNRDPVLLIGMAGGLAGAVAKVQAVNKTPVAGIVGVVANHAAYSAALVDRGARPSPMRVGLRVVAWATGVGLATWKKKPLIAPAIIAGVAVCATSTLADDRVLQDGSTPAKGLGHSGNLMLVSEGLSLFRETILTGDSFGHRLIDVAMTATSVTGHMLMVDGLTRRP